ncbi:hypothetical protein B0G62_104305 [Paraburkholderia eburnea]|uniref:Uncharacterized protein n=1 Tax=Paraburkholderia eburnea TaxID=1189126 RepID=A0A2S4ME32_9BURK|nr:hypothetical protein [Paraburkholderia eburnea]POR53008.1 hypothetical protein B0G62_104305 [Paraburkholderia eburnea]PRZ23875.1 hypothetical protein BX588_104304 [Paraburkholderia eburnea]
MTISVAASSNGGSTSFYALWASKQNPDDAAASGDTLQTSDDGSSGLDSNSSADPLAQAVAAALNSLGTDSDGGDGQDDEFGDLADNNATAADKLAALQQFLGSLFQAAAQQSGTVSTAGGSDAAYSGDLASAVSGLAQSATSLDGANSDLAASYENLLAALGVSSDDPLDASAMDLQQFLSTLAGNLQARGASSASGLFIDISA